MASVRIDVIMARVSADDGGSNLGLFSLNPTLGAVMVGLVGGGSDVSVLVVAVVLVTLGLFSKLALLRR